MVKKILIGVVAIILILVIVIAAQPTDFKITRTATLDASPPAVFEQVNDFHKWNDWSPWAKLDPNAKNTFQGPDKGPGAIFTWSGNSEVGEGRMTILESKPNDVVRIKLDFIRPFEDTSETFFFLKPEGNKTVVTWTMEGKRNFVAKAMCLVMDMDTMVGGQFEKGLASLEAASKPKADAKKEEKDSPKKEPPAEAKKKA